MFEKPLIDGGDDDLALVILEKTPLRNLNRAARGGANRNDAQLIRCPPQQGADLRGLGGGHVIGHQQQTPLGHGGIFQQSDGLGHGPLRAAAQRGHDERVQSRNHRQDCFGVIRQRRHHMTVAGIDHQGGLSFLALLEKIGELLFGPGQTVGLQVGCQSGQREVQNHHQMVGFGLQWLRLFLPGRSRQGNDRDQPQEGQGE